MKVLILHTVYKTRGGEEVIVENEKKLLISDGNIVDVIYFNNNKGTIPSLISFLQLPFNFSAYYRVKSAIKRMQPDIVHIHNWNFAASPSIVVAVKKAKKPVVFSIHNYRLICPSGTLFHNKKLFLNSLGVIFPWRAVKKAVYRDSIMQTLWLSLAIYLHKIGGTWRSVDKYIVNTSAKKELFLSSSLRLMETQVVVKPNSSADTGVELAARKGHFLFVGRLSEEKGISTLLEAFIKSPFLLTIVGDGPLREIVEKAGRFRENIIYKGRLPFSDIVAELKQTSALIFPSIWFEGMPMTIVEAFSTGTPVISSKIGAMQTMIIDGFNGLHFEPGNSNELLRAMQIWQNKSSGEKVTFCKNARLTYEQNYTPERNLEQLKAIYAAVL